jgi:hypothetical protein
MRLFCFVSKKLDNFTVNRNTCWEVKGRVSCPWRSTLA